MSPTSSRFSTPVSSLTCTGKARLPVGTVIGTARFWKSVLCTCAPAVMFVRAVLPTPSDTSPSTLTSRDGTAIVRDDSMSWVTTVPNGMSTAATTVGSWVGGALGWFGLTEGLLPWPRNSTTTNVSAARKMPSSKTSRLVRRTG